jgi:exodeoxyribonuclease VII large subunit
MWRDRPWYLRGCNGSESLYKTIQIFSDCQEDRFVIEKKAKPRMKEELMASLILKVSEVTNQIKTLLEENFPFVWVEGEISNLTHHSTGHYFFSLKDEKAQIRAIMFRYQAQNLRFNLENGIKAVVRGRIGVYEPRGEYQILADSIEPLGKGSLQLAFEQTKKKLEAEGLFDAGRKKPLPLLPQKIGIITSPTGAAIRDILHLVNQRFANLEIAIMPVRVQGPDAPGEIIAALELAGTVPDLDVVLLGRGGGSIEDLWAFNDEGVARAIARCNVPVVSAVGHEVDFTISDFVADVRAPTPSAAAEMVVKKKDDLLVFLETTVSRLERGIRHALGDDGSRLELAKKGLQDPRRKIANLNLRCDDLSQRMRSLSFQSLRRKREAWDRQKQMLHLLSPAMIIRRWRDEIRRKTESLETWAGWKIEGCRKTLEKAEAQLDAANPQSILKRGYSITRTWPEKKIVRDAATLSPRQELQVSLHKGEVLCTIEETKEE